MENSKGDYSESPLGDFRGQFFLSKRRPKGDFSVNKRGVLAILNYLFINPNKFEKTKTDTGHDLFWID